MPNQPRTDNPTRGFTVQRKDADGKPIGRRLTFTNESFIIEPIQCCCGQITSRLITCRMHPGAGSPNA